jgi:hypothetical protein
LSCGADFQSAVSQVFNLLGLRRRRAPLQDDDAHQRSPADCKSAIQQIENLRYPFGAPVCYEIFELSAREQEIRRRDAGAPIA